jgi:hypothetical protein
MHADLDQGDIIYGENYAMPAAEVSVLPFVSDSNAYAVFKAFDNIFSAYLAEEFRSRPVFRFMLACGALVTVEKSQESILEGFKMYVSKMLIAKMPLMSTPYKLQF